MTNIKKNTTGGNVHLHIEKAFKIIDAYLPYQYVDLVNEIISEEPVTIRNVRKRKKGKMIIINALLKVSLEEKKRLEEFELLIK